MPDQSYTAADPSHWDDEVDGEGNPIPPANSAVALDRAAARLAETQAAMEAARQAQMAKPSAPTGTPRLDSLEASRTTDQGRITALENGRATNGQLSSEATARSQGDANTLTSAEAYTDTKVSAEATARDSALAQMKADILGGAGPTVDTLKEIADKLANDESVAASLATTVGTKASQSDLAAEVTNRQNADATNLTAAKAYADTGIAAEASARSTAVTNEANTRATADSTEATARANGDTATLAAAKAYTDSKVARPARAGTASATLPASLLGAQTAGPFTVNFSTALPDTTYAVTAQINNPPNGLLLTSGWFPYVSAFTTTSATVYVRITSALASSTSVSLVVQAVPL